MEATANSAGQVIRCEFCILYTVHDQISYRTPETLMLLYQTDAVQLAEEQLGKHDWMLYWSRVAQKLADVLERVNTGTINDT